METNINFSVSSKSIPGINTIWESKYDNNLKIRHDIIGENTDELTLFN